VAISADFAVFPTPVKRLNKCVQLFIKTGPFRELPFYGVEIGYQADELPHRNYSVRGYLTPPAPTGRALGQSVAKHAR
jgi:hypothetical protein